MLKLKCFLFFLHVGRDQLTDILHTDFNRFNVNKLCTSVNKQCVIHDFPTAAPLEPFMKSFWIMTQECNSKIFVDFWHRRVTAVVQNRSADLALSDVEEELWTPVFIQCEELLDKLKEYSLSIQMVDQVFKGQPNIPGIVRQLYRGVEKCRKGHDVKDFTWITGVIARMNQYWKLCSFAKAADAFLKIRNALKLSGDFELVEQVASEVSGKILSLYLLTCTSALKAATSMEDQTLQAIDESVVNAAKFLEDYATDSKKEDCLRAYAESQRLVKWIREETEGL